MDRGDILVLWLISLAVVFAAGVRVEYSDTKNRGLPMTNATYEVLELRAVIEPELTRLYIRCGPDSDGGYLVGGWYTKTIPASEPSMKALTDALVTASYLKWDRGAP